MVDHMENKVESKQGMREEVNKRIIDLESNAKKQLLNKMPYSETRLEFYSQTPDPSKNSNH